MIEVAVAPKVSEAVRDTMLEIGSWQLGMPSSATDRDFNDIAVFASGDRANNKLIGDLVLAPYELYAHAIPRWRRVSRKQLFAARTLVLDSYDAMLDAWETTPDAVYGIPNGGQDLAVERAGRRERRGTILDIVHLEKAAPGKGNKSLRPASPTDAKLLRNAHRMVGSEAVGNLGTSLATALHASDEYGLTALREKTMGLDYLWIRGSMVRKPEDMPIHTIVHKLIPARIQRKDAFYQKFGHLAVMV